MVEQVLRPVNCPDQTAGIIPSAKDSANSIQVKVFLNCVYVWLLA